MAGFEDTTVKYAGGSSLDIDSFVDQNLFLSLKSNFETSNVLLKNFIEVSIGSISKPFCCSRPTSFSFKTNIELTL